MAILITLTPEIQHEIIKKLRYPDLVRLYMTCQYMRDLPTPEIIRDALHRLEIDCVTIGKRYWQMIDNDPDRSTLSNISTRAIFETIFDEAGYCFRDFCSTVTGETRLSDLAPCYSCLKLLPKRAFEINTTRPANGIFPMDRLLEYHGMPPQYIPLAGRQCVGCGIKKGRPNENMRWIETLTRRAIVLCPDCMCYKEVNRECHPWRYDQRQVLAAMCDECWAPEAARWAETETRITQYKFEIEQYWTWMQSNKIGRIPHLHGVSARIQPPPAPPSFLSIPNWR